MRNLIRSHPPERSLNCQMMQVAITNSRGLKMAHLNINGLLSKLDFIKIKLSESKFDIFPISEFKLDASIHENENGPLLFLLYINDVKSVIQNSYCHLYADDTIIIKSASDPDSLMSNLERELLNVDQWLSINKMTVNTKKN